MFFFLAGSCDASVVVSGSISGFDSSSGFSNVVAFGRFDLPLHSANTVSDGLIVRAVSGGDSSVSEVAVSSTSSIVTGWLETPRGDAAA